MPELPEVETTKNGLYPHVINQTVHAINIHQTQLRYKIPSNLAACLPESKVIDIQRRAKYIIWDMMPEAHEEKSVPRFQLLWHLGMSGSMRIMRADEPLKKHDHVEIYLANDKKVVYHDPRRFGCLLMFNDVSESPLINLLGPEPLSADFNADYLYRMSKLTHANIKQFIMNQKIVVGVGNIYASESLFLAKISPKRKANNISYARFSLLAEVIKQVLSNAIAVGGTTLRDFVSVEGQPGYFAQTLNVYNQLNKPCVDCSRPIKRIVQQNRATYYCSFCQR